MENKIEIQCVMLSFKHPFSEKEAIKKATEISKKIKMPVEFLTDLHGIRCFANFKPMKWQRIDRQD